MIGRPNAQSGAHCVLMSAPGAGARAIPFLGIPVLEINHVAALCEIVAMHDNLRPTCCSHPFSQRADRGRSTYFSLFPEAPGNEVDEATILRWFNRLVELLPADGERPGRGRPWRPMC